MKSRAKTVLKAEAGSMETGRERKYCRSCGHELKPGMRICDSCGSIQRPSKGSREKGASTLSGMVPCKFCGKETGREESLCGECAALEERIASGYYRPDVPLPEKTGMGKLLGDICRTIRRFFRKLFRRKGKRP